MDLLFSRIVYGNWRSIQIWPNRPSIGNGWAFIFAESGFAWNAGDFPNWTQASDARIKTNIQPITSGLSNILQLNPVTFQWIHPELHGDNTSNVPGFIAQEFQTIFPDQVMPGGVRSGESNLIPDGNSLNINKNLDPYIVKAIQELNSTIQQMQLDINMLKAREIILTNK